MVFMTPKGRFDYDKCSASWITIPLYYTHNHYTLQTKYWFIDADIRDTYTALPRLKYKDLLIYSSKNISLDRFPESLINKHYKSVTVNKTHFCSISQNKITLSQLVLCIPEYLAAQDQKRLATVARLVSITVSGVCLHQ